MWGGKFNPIIPYFDKVPTWWNRHGHRFETAKQIINGYLDLYEPDFLVEFEEGMSKGYGFHSERVLKPSDVLANSRKGSNGCGIGAFDLYQDLYEKKYQFERRHKQKIVNVKPEDSRFDAFSTCVFGGFPPESKFEYFEIAFNEIFDPLAISLNGDSLSELHSSWAASALDVGQARIEVEYGGYGEQTIFVLDAFKPRDLIDFWNLRTLRPDIVPIPVQWAKELAAYSRGFIERSYRPLKGNPHGLMHRANVMFSRSIPSAEIERIYKEHFWIDVEGANLHQNWYPAIWRPTPNYVVEHWTRPILRAAEKTFDVSYSEDNLDIRFDSLHPEFANKYGNENRWANVVTLRDWGFKNQVATTIPTEFRDPKFSPFRSSDETFLATTEGFVIFPRYREIQHYWTLSDGVTAIAEWLKIYKINAKVSEAGRATQQIIQTLGGFKGVRGLANAQVISLLNEMSRKPIIKAMQHQEFINKVNAAVKGDMWLERAAEILISQNAVELGLEARCTKCSSWNWYALKNLDNIVNCGLCLKDFNFPKIHEGKDSPRWAYRLIGPFALPGYANGGYSASLAIRFFCDVIGHHRTNVTWSSGQELTFQNDPPSIEADFILWYQRTQLFGASFPTKIVFGEAKSFGRNGSEGTEKKTKRAAGGDVFTDDDVARMKRLAEEFPGAVLVFATMKEADRMSKDEIARLRALAQWGREYLRGSRQTRAPVILLTGTELFCGYSLEETWKKKGGIHEQLCLSGPYLQVDKLEILADLTQYLYLGLPRFREWHEARLRTKQKRREIALLENILHT